MSTRPLIIAVCGGGEADDDVRTLAIEVGRELALVGAYVVTGGLGGVMEMACRGAKEGGGTTIGIVPGIDTRIANEYVDIPIASGMADGRNAIIVQTADGVIALPGRYGTLSEIAMALIHGKPVVSIGGWQPSSEVKMANDARSAVRMIQEALA